MTLASRSESLLLLSAEDGKDDEDLHVEGIIHALDDALDFEKEFKQEFLTHALLVVINDKVQLVHSHLLHFVSNQEALQLLHLFHY